MNRAIRYYLRRWRYRLRICVHLPRWADVVRDLINTRDARWPFSIREMSDSLLPISGIAAWLFASNEEYEKIEAAMRRHHAPGNPAKTGADCPLYANGRTGNTDRWR